MSRAGIEAGRAVIRVYIDDHVNQGLKAINSKLTKFNYALKGIGDQAIRGGFIGSITSGFLTKKFIDFEDVILNLRAKLGLFDLQSKSQNSTLTGLEETIRLLGRTTSYTAQQVGEAAVSLAQAGLSAKEIKNTLQPVLDLGRGTGFGLSESADMLSNGMRTFNIQTSSAGEVVSQFVRATRLGTLEIQDLQEALKYASGSAFNLEQTLPTMLGLFVQMSESGLKASLAGTSLNTAMLNMVGNLEKLKKTFPGFNLEMDALGKLNLQGTLTQLFKLTKKLSAVERVGVFQDIFNIRGARAISSVQEIERVLMFTDSIKAGGDEGRKAANVMESGLGGAFRRATSASNDFFLTIGKINKELQQAALNAFPAFAARLEQLAVTFPPIVIALTNFPYLLLGAGVGLVGFVFVLDKIIKLSVFLS